VRHTGGTNMDPTVVYERAGVPGVHICIDTTYEQAMRSAMVHGMPTIRIVVLSSEKWCSAGNNPENFIGIAEDARMK
jgi:hypothetical protein